MLFVYENKILKKCMQNIATIKKFFNIIQYFQYKKRLTIQLKFHFIEFPTLQNLFHVSIIVENFSRTHQWFVEFY